MFNINKILISTAAVALMASAPAMAQKSKDTLRFGLYQPIKALDRIFVPHPETNLTAPAVYDALIFYDAEKRVFKPHLAKSWKRIDKLTLELKLRDDVKFHDGTDFDADDVVYMFNFVTDPKVNFRFKGTRFGWVKSVEKIDRYTVRIKSKAVYAPVLSRLSGSPPMYPSEYHGSLKVKSTFGRKPVGTGPYKVTMVDPNKGMTFVLNKNYKLSASKPAGKIGTLKAVPIPDAQTQVAQLMSGGIEIMYNVPKDQARNLASNPALSISVTPTVSFVYLLLDAADRSKIGHFKNKLVRQAIFTGINRNALKKALVPDQLQGEPLQKAICHSWHLGCVTSVEPPAYDLAKAKKMLAEAGLGKGFDLEITTWGASKLTAEAVAGQLRKMGIKAKIDGLTIGPFVKKRARGKVQAFVSLWDNGGGAPDVDVTAGFFFMKGSRNYMHDDALSAAHKKGQRTIDLEARKKIYRAAFDRVTNEAYMMPLIPLPVVLAHHKSVAVHGGHKNPEGFELNRVSWK